MTKILAWDCSPKVPSLIPFFLPFAGCPFRCLYCAQDLVTGQEHHDPLSLRFQRLHKELLQRRRPDRDPPQLAFYGGTFTALPLDAMNYCLEQAQHLLEQGLISALRCSTRPDALPDDRLLRLREAGMTTIELGIQSFDEGALRATERGYGSIKACEACTKVKDYGFELGVQLLPGMPGLSPGRFLKDVSHAISLGAGLLRFYPCQVLAKTKLAALWRKGLYSPWDLQTTLATLAVGYLKAQDAHVPVIRMGLAPEPSFLQARLAGPWHPSLGARVMARALYLAVLRAKGRAKLVCLRLPRRLQGFFFGEKGEMREKWARLACEILFGNVDRVELDLLETHKT